MSHWIKPVRRRTCNRECCPVPPSPDAIAQLYARFLELKEARRLPRGMTFDQYYAVWRSGRRGENFVGLDDGALRHAASTERQLIDRPPKTVIVNLVVA